MCEFILLIIFFLHYQNYFKYIDFKYEYFAQVVMRLFSKTNMFKKDFSNFCLSKFLYRY